MNRRSAVCRCALLMVALAFAAVPPAFARCQLAKIATFPLLESSHRLLIPGKLNGHDVSIFVDTGAGESLIWRRAAEQAGLHMTRDPGWKMVGLSGDMEVYKTKVAELQVGDYTISGRVWPVIGGPQEMEIGMILGADFWSKVDFEINFPGREITLWQALDCKEEPLVYWSQEYMMANLSRGRGRSIVVDVAVNGVRLRALLDTGAPRTVMDLRHARRVGYRQDPAGEGGEVRGLGRRGGVDSIVGIFDQFSMGDLTVNNARIVAFDMDRHTRETGGRIQEPMVDFEDMLIGADFLRANRIFVANSQDRLYMTYLGGRIFQTDEPSGSMGVNGVRLD